MRNLNQTRKHQHDESPTKNFCFCVSVPLAPLTEAILPTISPLVDATSTEIVSTSVCACACIYIQLCMCRNTVGWVPTHTCKSTHNPKYVQRRVKRPDRQDWVSGTPRYLHKHTYTHIHKHKHTNSCIYIHLERHHSGSSAMTAQACAWTYTHTHAYRKAFHCTYPYLYYDSDVSISMCVSRYDSDVTKSILWRAVTVPHTLTLSHTHVTHSVTWGIHVCATTHSYDIDHSLVVCYTRRARSFIHVRRNSSISRISSSQMPTTRVSFLRVFFFPLVFFKDKTSIALLSRGRRRISQTLGHQYPRNLTIT